MNSEKRAVTACGCVTHAGRVTGTGGIPCMNISFSPIFQVRIYLFQKDFQMVCFRESLKLPAKRYQQS
jgi:hypothetical protein